MTKKNRRSKDRLTPAERLAKFNIPEAIVSDEIELPIGLSIDGTVIKTARVRGSNAGDRKAAAAGGNRSSAAHVATTFLSRCVTDLGGHKPTVPLLRKMTEPDRNFLIMEIRKQTWPDNYEMLATAECTNPDCGEKTDFPIDLDEVEIIDVESTWYDDLPCFEEANEDGTLTVRMHYLLGGDMEDISRKYGNQGRNEVNPVGIADEMVLSMIMELNGQEVTMEDLEVFPQPVVSFLDEAIEKHQAGPQLNHSGRCIACGRKVEVQVNIMDFLLRGQVKKESMR